MRGMPQCFRSTPPTFGLTAGLAGLSRTVPALAQPDIQGSNGFCSLRGVKKLPCRLEVFYAGKYDGRNQTIGESGRGNPAIQLHWFSAAKTGWRNAGLHGLVCRPDRTLWKRHDRAFGANLGMGVTLPMKWRPRLAGQFTWGSGDRNPMDGIHGTFDGVFGGADINFYGDLNLFYWANLRDYEFDLHLHLRPNATLMIENHYFTLDQASDAWYTTGMAAIRRDTTGFSGKALGDEFNLRLSWQLAKKMDVLIGWGYFSPAEFVKRTGPADAASGYFLQAAYAFCTFNSTSLCANSTMTNDPNDNIIDRRQVYIPISQGSAIQRSRAMDQARGAAWFGLGCPTLLSKETAI